MSSPSVNVHFTGADPQVLLFDNRAGVQIDGVALWPTSPDACRVLVLKLEEVRSALELGAKNV